MALISALPLLGNKVTTQEKYKDTRMISFEVMSLLHSSDFATVIALLKRLG